MGDGSMSDGGSARLPLREAVVTAEVDGVDPRATVERCNGMVFAVRMTGGTPFDVHDVYERLTRPT